jgi:lipase ATG15
MLRRLDIHPETLVATTESGKLGARPSYKLRSRPRAAARLKDRSKETIESYLYASRLGLATSFAEDAWTTHEIRQPNITDKATVLQLAKIAADAYIEVQYTEDWLEVGTPYNVSHDFGWDGDSLRGHVFADETNSTVIIGLKGTSMAVFDGAETTTNDKVNDNLLFSCCCARLGYWWKTVCDCYSGTAYTCNHTCLGDALREENKYYRAALNLYYNVTQLYPSAEVWMSGHSLGGALSSLVGQTYNIPAIAFEAPGEALASERLSLPLPPGQISRQRTDIPVYHFGTTADPIFMGTCNGPTSACSIGGYALETHCHAGMECVYDVVSDRGWRMGLGYHRIQGVIKDVIETYDTVPECKAEPDCVDCFNWKFVDGNETTTTTTTTPAPTTTSTCKTPGWWGCRDETTATTTTTSDTTTTTTCTSYGWFGNCLDPTTTATSAPSSMPTSTSATTTSDAPSPTWTPCKTHGWFGGCLDETASSTATPTQTCETPGRFWGCRDPVPTETPKVADLEEGYLDEL